MREDSRNWTLFPMCYTLAENLSCLPISCDIEGDGNQVNVLINLLGEASRLAFSLWRWYCWLLLASSTVTVTSKTDQKIESLLFCRKRIACKLVQMRGWFLKRLALKISQILCRGTKSKALSITSSRMQNCKPFVTPAQKSPLRN